MGHAVLFYTHKLGSQYHYREHLLDVRRYVSLNTSSMLGFQVIGHLTAGNVPLRELPRLGGPNIMRGFVLGRYRDRQLWSAQAEYRHTLNRFLVAAAFAAAGGVALAISEITLADARYTGGVGLRVLLNRKKKVYLRTDVALNSNRTVSVYVRMLEAF